MKDCLEDHFMKGIKSKFTQIIFSFFFIKELEMSMIYTDKNLD